MGRLQDKVTLITGGGTGIGKATALIFSQEGSKIVVFGRREPPIKNTAEVIRKSGCSAIYCVGDVSDSSDVRKAINSTIETYERLDIVINSAGVVRRGENFIKTTEKNWDYQLDINLKGFFLISKYAIRQMINQGGGGVIINISSIISSVGAEGYSTYAATKGGTVSLARNLAVDYGRYNIRINSISPGIVETPMSYVDRENFDEIKGELEKLQPLGRLGKPEDIAYANLFLASNEASWITGQELIVDGGYTIV
jgi:NAD(P)-dependent dehydrogenase (short-subunit alcohol dehydrogenase family)